MKVHDKLYINGQWIKPKGAGMIDVTNSTTEEVMGRVPEGSFEDVNAAVAAAKAAFEKWSMTTIEERARYLRLISDRLNMRKDEIAAIIASEVGMPLPLSLAVQAGMPAAVMGSYAKMLGEFKFEEQIGAAAVVKEPVGVVGCITPWNFPLHQVVCKVAPALAAGCAIVLKPSEVAPLTAFVLAEICDDVGLPAGVFNLVTGYGPVVGE
ncbi:MAG TPA: aldehyde dehydrogenase family protein, partial [Blastocatellia bacterium]|nr:aldehyde dehydrogenase family protein [Blastocatellia bacterium]